MFAHFRSQALIGVVLLAAVSLAGCSVKSTSRSSGKGNFGAREVKYSLDVSGGIVVQPNSATINFTGGKVVVEKARVLLDDREVARVPENARLVEVNLTAGTLTITADGVRIHEGKLNN